MTPWQSLEHETISTPRDEKIEGVKVITSPSFYDVPEAIRVFSAKDTQKLVIDLRYLGTEWDEPKQELSAPTHVSLRIGANSGRIYRVEIPKIAGRITVEVFTDTLRSAIDFLRKLAGSDTHRVERYDLAERAILKNQTLILQRESSSNVE